MKRIPAHWRILAALVLATLLAMRLRSMVSGAATVLAVCAFTGDLFMQALKMLIVPLIVTSVVAGIASLQGVQGFGRLGLKTAAFYVSTSLASILLGLVLVNAIRPGFPVASRTR